MADDTDDSDDDGGRRLVDCVRNAPTSSGRCNATRVAASVATEDLMSIDGGGISIQCPVPAPGKLWF